MESFFRSVIRFRVLIILVIPGLTFAAGLQIPKLRFESDAESMIPQTTQSFTTTMWLKIALACGTISSLASSTRIPVRMASLILVPSRLSKNSRNGLGV